MAKPTLRRYKPGELGGMDFASVVEDEGYRVVLARKGIQRTLGRSKTKTNVATLSRGVLGAYRPSNNTMYLDKNRMTKQTVHHESGHAVDWTHERPSQAAPFRANAKGTPNNEWKKILVARFNGYVAPSDRIKQHAALLRRVSNDYYSYMNSGSERFADALGQWRTNPTAFNSYAPTIAKWFRDNKDIL